MKPDNYTIALAVIGIVSVVYIAVFPSAAKDIIPVLTGVVGYLAGSEKNA